MRPAIHGPDHFCDLTSTDPVLQAGFHVGHLAEGLAVPIGIAALTADHLAHPPRG